MRSFKPSRPKKKPQGFSLIEAVMAIVIISILALSIMFFTVPAMNLWAYQAFEQGPVGEAKLAMMRMSREINQVKDRASISTATAGAFDFTDANNQSIDYALNGAILERTAGSGAKALAKSISALQFTYYNKAGGSPAASADIRRIEIQLTVTAGGKTKTLRSMIRPRNLF